MLKEYARLARPFFVMLAIVTVGRWVQGTVFGVPYEKGTHVFSIVTLTLFASLFSAVFTRAWLGWRLPRGGGLCDVHGRRRPGRDPAVDSRILRPGHRELLQPPDGAQPAGGGLASPRRWGFAPAAWW